MAHALHAEPAADDRPLPAPRRSRSSAPASPASAWPSACSRRASRTSWSSSATATSAAPGGPTPIPGCQCDIPSHLYSFSFAPNPDWTRTYPKQPEIARLPAQRVAERFGVAPAHPPRLRGHRAPTGTRRAAAGACRAPTGRPAPPTCSSPRPGPLSEPSIPDIARPRPLRGRDLPHRAAGTTTTTSPASASR